MDEQLAHLPGALLPWYEENRRDLPWRKDKDPYHIWVSEIMLQQTRVEAVKGYYARFLEALPSVQTLADCDEERMNFLMEETGWIQDMLDHHDFYIIDAKVDEIARALGLSDLGMDRDVTELSGGQRTKILLGKLLLEKPDTVC